MRVDPELILQLVGYHQRLFGGGVLPTIGIADTLTSSAGSVVSGRGLGALEKGKGGKGRGKKAARGRDGKPIASSTPAASSEVEEKTDAWRLGEAQREATTAVRQAHDLATELLPAAGPLLPASLDTESRGSQLALTCWTWQLLQGRQTATEKSEQTREVFAEENSEEVGKLAPIVESVRERVSELVAQWPEHATLQLLDQICERLSSFRVGSPLRRFVAGAELLLKQLVNWEQYACRATSIKEQIDTLSALVLRWRKMELHAWPKLLECAATQAHEKALSNVWVRLFRVVHSSSASKPSAASDESTAVEGADADATAATSSDVANHLKEFFEVVEQMMLSSSAGSYEAHLQLVSTFEAQLRVEEKLGVEQQTNAEGGEEMAERERRRGYANILHHLAGYHRQFSPLLKSAVEKEMEPIATKLADFVQLGQWNDRNYAQLKQSIERSHQQLNRCVQQFKGVLEQPAATLLANASKAHDAEAAGDAQKAAETRAADPTASDAHALAVLRDMAFAKSISANASDEQPSAVGATTGRQYERSSTRGAEERASARALRSDVPFRAYHPQQGRS